MSIDPTVTRRAGRRETVRRSSAGRLHPLVVAAAATLALSACGGEEVTHFRVPKQGAAPAATAAGAPPGMAGEVAPPPEVGSGQGLRWTLPAGWTESRGGGMRYASLVPPGSGRVDGSVTVLSGQAGGELANVNRWRGQIGLPAIDEAALATARRPFRSKAGPLALYDFTSDGEKKSRLLAGILETGGSTWFVKLTGDADAVGAARAGFLELLGSLRFDAAN